MSKELECLEKLGTHRIEYKEGFELGFTKTMPFKNTTEYKIIKQSLQRLEAIDNSNPSEALEDLEQLAEMADKCWVSCDVHKWKNTIKQALLKAQVQEKVLEIILKKCVDIDYLKNDCHFVLVLYNKIMEDSKQLTQEEFELLKRWLNEMS